MKQAEATLASAKRDKEAGDFNWSCFKAQQAAEFAVKDCFMESVFHRLVIRFLNLLEKSRGRT
jgi:HEPN domain-containing protein